MVSNMPLCVLSSFSEMAEYLITSAENNKSISVLLYFNEASQLLTEIIKLGNVKVFDIDIAKKESRGYDNLYVVSLTETKEIFVEPIYCDKKYIGVSGKTIYIDYRADSNVWIASKTWNDDNTQYIKIRFDNK